MGTSIERETCTRSGAGVRATNQTTCRCCTTHPCVTHLSSLCTYLFQSIPAIISGTCTPSAPALHEHTTCAVGRCRRALVPAGPSDRVQARCSRAQPRGRVGQAKQLQAASQPGSERTKLSSARIRCPRASTSQRRVRISRLVLSSFTDCLSSSHRTCVDRGRKLSRVPSDSRIVFLALRLRGIKTTTRRCGVMQLSLHKARRSSLLRGENVT